MKSVKSAQRLEDVERIFKYIPMGITYKDLDFRVQSMNPYLLNKLGMMLEDVVGKRCYEIKAESRGEDPSGAAPCGHCLVPKVIETGDTQTFVNVVNRDLIIETTAVPIKEEGEAVVGILELVKDITGWKKEEDASRKARDELELKEGERTAELKEANTRLETLLRFIPDLIAFKDAGGRHVVTNKALEKFMGLSRDELIGKNADDIFPPEVAAQCKRSDDIAMRSSGPIRSEEIIGEGDDMVVMDTIKAPIRDEEGNVKGLVMVSRDISDRKQAEEKLKAQGKRLAESQRIANIGSWEHNLATNQAFWSDEYFRLLGLDPEKDTEDFDLFFSMVHPEDQPLLRKTIEETLQFHKPYNIDYRFILKDGTTRIIRALAELIPDSSGNLVILSGTGQDVTERKLAEEKIRKSEEFIRNILNTVDEGFIVVDRDYRIVLANKAYCEQVCLPCEEVVGKHCYKVSHQAEWPCFEAGEDCAVREVFATGDSCTTIHKHIDADGEVLFVETKAFPNKDEAGQVVSAIETVRNITERHLLEAERLKTQKLEAIGTLAGGIAHDFNNLLQGVFGYVSMAKLSRDKPEEVAGLLEQAEQALSMSVNLTKQLLTFAKGGKPVIESSDLRPVIENAAKFALSGSRCSCRLDIAQDLWSAEADAGQMGQVIQNIVLNASEAMPEGGSIDVSAANLEIHDETNMLLPDGGKFIKIVIRDTGPGISERNQTRIFDPYFTTKQKGSGLGLATSYSIIRNHGGAIEVLSKPDSGAAFLIYLPASERSNGGSAGLPGESTARKCRILVVDDEKVILDVAQKMITALGHEAALAKDGENAIEEYRQAFVSENPFDIVILDLTIRDGLGGDDILKSLLEIDPNVKAVVSSGYSDSPVISNFQAYGFSAVLSKPYSLNALRACLDALASQP